MRSTTRVLWLTIITLMAVLTACTSTPPSRPAATLTAGTEAAEIAPEDPGRTEETGMVSENPSLVENMTENENTQSTKPHQAKPHQDNPTGKRYRRSGRSGRPGPETITVPGRGTADAPPDFIRLHLGAIKHGKDPVVILGNVTQATSAMKDEANNQRIKSEDIQTSAFQVHERRVYNPETHEYQQEGFTATQNTSVTIRDLEMADMIVGRLIDAMGYAGEAELTLQGVSSGLDDPERLRLLALEKATTNLWQQARMVARTSNRVICRLLETQAGGAGQHHGKTELRSGPSTIRGASTSMKSMPDSYSRDASISPGIIQESSWITGVFELTTIGMTDEHAKCQRLP